MGRIQTRSLFLIGFPPVPALTNRFLPQNPPRAAPPAEPGPQPAGVGTGEPERGREGFFVRSPLEVPSGPVPLEPGRTGTPYPRGTREGGCGGGGDGGGVENWKNSHLAKIQRAARLASWQRAELRARVWGSRCLSLLRSIFPPLHPKKSQGAVNASTTGSQGGGGGVGGFPGFDLGCWGERTPPNPSSWTH